MVEEWCTASRLFSFTFPSTHTGLDFRAQRKCILYVFFVVSVKVGPQRPAMGGLTPKKVVPHMPAETDEACGLLDTLSGV